MSATAGPWKYLAPNPESSYRQLFIKDRRIPARTLYGWYASDEAPVSAEEIAAGYGLPLEAVLEAIAYCESNPPEIAADWEMEEALEQRTRKKQQSTNGPPGMPPTHGKLQAGEK
jgi:uncharacterized protein (DUF433 family)